jgi:PAS domain S-box-containing protein
MNNQKLKHYVTKGLFFKSVVEDGYDLIFVVDYEGQILYHNNAVRQTLGYPNNSLTGKNFFDFIRDESLKSATAGFKSSIRKSHNRSIELQFRCRDGAYKFLEFNSINLKHEAGINGLILDCRDITQRKKDAAELLRAQQIKEQFLANISHELRTPINGISGITALLTEGTPPEETKTYLNAIRSAADNLKTIINDILDVSSIESGKLKFERIGFNLEDLVSTLETTFSVQARQKNLQLIFELEPETKRIFFGDPARLNQMLINLLGNALKFTAAGTVSLKVGVKEKHGKKYYLRFEVRDTGIGIAKEKITHLFERFSQADSSVTRKFGGTGLGLTIVKQLAELQHGSVEVKSLEGVGSVFSLIIPYDSGKMDTRAKTGLGHLPQPEKNLKNLSILLAEDNDINQLYATSILKSWGLNFEIAENGAVAIEKLKTKHFNLVLMDIQMPVMDGFEATRQIRSGAVPNWHIPIIALTANATQNIIEQCKKSGMNDHLPKPFSPAELLDLLRRYAQGQPSDERAVRKKNKSNSLRPFDLTYLIQVSNHNEEFIDQIVQSFLTNAEQYILSIRTKLPQGDLKGIAAAVHKIKPSLSMVGALQAKESATRIETMVEEKTGIEQLKPLIEQFTAQVEETINALQQYHFNC